MFLVIQISEYFPKDCFLHNAYNRKKNLFTELPDMRKFSSLTIKK